MEDKNSEKKTAAENLNDMFEAFGTAMSQIFNDPVLKEKAKDLGRAAKESAERLGQRFKDEEAQSRFRDVGRAAQAFGKNVADVFADDRPKDQPGGDKPSA